MDSDEDGVGRFVTMHPVDKRRHWIRGGIALGCAVLGALLLAWFIASGEAPARLPAVALLLVVIGAPIAVNQLENAVRGGSSESVELHANGLVHNGRRVRSWTWEQGAVVQVGSAFQDIVRRGHLGCTVRFTDGGRIRINDQTGDGLNLVNAVRFWCQPAVRFPRQDPSRRVWLYSMVVLFVASVVSAISFINLLGHRHNCLKWQCPW